MANQPSNTVPSSQSPLVTPNLLITPPWLQYLTKLLAQPGVIASVSLTGSPFSFTASERGTAFIVGGTVSAIRITRSSVTLATGQTSGNIPLAQGDMLTVTYSGAPTISFVPG